jgi:class 3 adenylate cyclase
MVTPYAWERGMQCVQCQHENASDAKFCNQCAAPFAPVCSACGYKNPANAKFCNQCGVALRSAASAASSVQPMPSEAEAESRFHALIPSVILQLQRERRMTYRRLKYLFALDDMLLEEVKEELRFTTVARDEDGRGLVWNSETQTLVPSVVAVPSSPVMNEPTAVTSPVIPSELPLVPPAVTPNNGPTTSPEDAPPDAPSNEPVVVSEPIRSVPKAERRQLTVMFCDLVGSTDLSGKLDPEDLREVVRAYQETAAEVIERYEGHIAQYLGDGLLIYFGFPVAHEDDAQRAVYTGLEIPQAMGTLNTRLATDYGVQLAIRIGIHTGPVVVGEMGGGERHENLALGETPNIAARLEGLAQTNTAVISPVTAQLVRRSFVLEKLGPHDLKGVAEPMMLYTVVSSREAERDDHEHMLSGGFDALVGRDEEIGLLPRRWEQSKEGLGHVVLLSGEAGIGKSSLVEGLRDHVRQAGCTRIAFRCSPYHTHSAFYPIIEHVQRALGWQPEDPVDTQLVTLEQALAGTSLVWRKRCSCSLRCSPCRCPRATTPL